MELRFLSLCLMLPNQSNKRTKRLKLLRIRRCRPTMPTLETKQTTSLLNQKEESRSQLLKAMESKKS